MARHLNGGLGEEVTDDTLLPRSPTTDRRHDPAWRRDDPPDRRPVPGQHLLRHPAVAPLPQHRLGRAEATRRGREVVPLPPYSPDDSPIEEMFSMVKGAMRS